MPLEWISRSLAEEGKSGAQVFQRPVSSSRSCCAASSKILYKLVAVFKILLNVSANIWLNTIDSTLLKPPHMPNHPKNSLPLPQRWVVMGVSGCGKSEIGARLAARLGIDYFEGDHDHPPHNIAKMAAGMPLDDADRDGWLRQLQARLRDAAAHGKGLVLPCSALKRHYRDLLRQGDPDLFFVHLDGSRALIAARMQARANHFMPVSLLDSQFNDLEPLQPDERGMRLDIALPPEVLIEQILHKFDAASGKE